MFLSGRDGGAEVYVMNVDGSNPIRLTNNAVVELGPAWSPDGKRITFYAYRDPPGTPEVYIMKADGSAQTELTNNPASDITPA